MVVFAFILSSPSMWAFICSYLLLSACCACSLLPLFSWGKKRREGKFVGCYAHHSPHLSHFSMPVIRLKTQDPCAVRVKKVQGEKWPLSINNNFSIIAGGCKIANDSLVYCPTALAHLSHQTISVQQYNTIAPSVFKPKTSGLDCSILNQFNIQPRSFCGQSQPDPSRQHLINNVCREIITSSAELTSEPQSCRICRT